LAKLFFYADAGVNRRTQADDFQFVLTYHETGEPLFAMLFLCSSGPQVHKFFVAADGIPFWNRLLAPFGNSRVNDNTPHPANQPHPEPSGSWPAREQPVGTFPRRKQQLPLPPPAKFVLLVG
jgi:hypothetical protein